MVGVQATNGEQAAVPHEEFGYEINFLQIT